MGIVYAIFKNGMWDDPGVANAGSIAKSFKAKADECGFASGRIEPYLTWRFCYLICGVLFGLIRVIVGWPGNLNEGGDKYSDFLTKQLPKSVDPARFDDLVEFLKYEELAVWVLTTVSFLMLVAATCTAIPACAIQKTNLSRRLVWCGWLFAFVPPFFLFLTFPVRSMGDWDGVMTDVCSSSVRGVLNVPGSDLKSTITAATQEGMLDSSLAGVVTDPAAWCEKEGDTWHETFYGSSVGCAWELEDRCQETFCLSPAALAAGSDITQCLSSCPTYAVQSGGGKQARDAMVKMMSGCTNNARFSEDALGKPPAMPKKTDNQQQSVLKLFQLGVYGQRRAILEGSQVVTLASVQAEYVVGVLIALVAGRYLIPGAISVLGGLAEALLNGKAIFPGTQHGAWILILTTFEVMPIYAALLAMVQQLVGDTILAVACVLAAAYSGLGIVTGFRIMNIKSGNDEREKMYKLIWFEYGLRVLCGVGIIGALVAWASLKHDGLQDYVQNELLTPNVLGLALIDTLSKKIYTAIAGTDVVLSAFVQTEKWDLTMTEKDKSEAETQVNDFDRFMTSGAASSQTGPGVP